MITWNNLQSDIVYHSISRYTSNLSLLDTIKLVCAIDEGPLVVVSKHCLTSIFEHVITSQKELGGLLVGNVYINPISKTPNLVIVSENIQSVECDSTGVSLRMESNIWNNAREKISNGLIVVGWYHSHPNLGAFFSGTDRRNQRYNFNHVYSVGYVIDPFINESKWFIGADSDELSSKRVITKG